MAQSIKGPTAGTAKKRGRPNKAEAAARAQREQDAQRQIDANGGNLPADMKEGAAAAPAAEKPKPGKAHTGPPAAKPKGDSAPAFGANRATEGMFLRHIQKLRQKGEEIEIAKGVVKLKRGELKDLRNLAKADGIVLGELDEALEALETERVDLLAREERRVLYFEWLGLPTLRSADSAKIERTPAKRWAAMGEIDGRLGKPRVVPDTCDGSNVQDYLHGWDKGQRALMSESDLTGDGFKDGADPHAEGVAARDAAGAGAAPDTPPDGAPAVEEAAAAPALFILNAAHFEAGTALEDCNRKTLLEDHVAQWDASERVVVVLGSQKRVLKEPDYEDTGEPDAPISDPEEPTAEEVAAAEGRADELADVADRTAVEALGDTPGPETVTGQDDPETFH